MSRSFLLGGATLVVVSIAIVFAALRLYRPTAIVAQTRSGSAVNAIPANVRVIASNWVVRSEVDGVLEANVAKSRDRVARDDLMATLDTTMVDIEIEKLEEDLEGIKRRIELGTTLEANLAEARNLLRRLEGEFELGAVSQSTLDQQRLNVASLETRIQLETLNHEIHRKSVLASISLKQRHREKMNIRAPVDGTVVLLGAFPQEYIHANRVLFHVQDDTRRVEARINESDLSGVRLDQSTNIRFLPYGSQLFSGKVTVLPTAAESGTQEYSLLLEVDIDKELLIPGMTGEASIILDERSQTLTIPRRAVIGGKVFVVNNDRVEVREVEVGFRSHTRVEILSGLNEGDLVVVEELDRFEAGDRVHTQLPE